MENTRKLPGLSGSFLKIIAIICMCLDHFAAALLQPLRAQWTAMGLPGDAYWSSAYTILRTAGRLAFPIFAFLLVEGFLHTRNPVKYAGRLALFALISEIPYDLCLQGSLFTLTGQNVFFTLLLGLLALMSIKQFSSKPLLQTLCVLLALCAAQLLSTDYGALGVALIVLLYLLRDKPKFKFTAAGLVFLAMGISKFTSLRLVSMPLLAYGSLMFLSSLLFLGALLAFPLLYAYNGQQGAKLPKYLLYAVYPAHLLLYWLILQFIRL